MTDEDLKKWRDRANAATPRPWRALAIRASYDAKIQGSFVRGPDDECSHVAVRLTADDAEFVAAARDAVPELLDEVDRLRPLADLGASNSGRIDDALATSLRDAKAELELLRAVLEAAETWRESPDSLIVGWADELFAAIDACRAKDHAPILSQRDQLSAEVERLRLSEASWNKEAERHARDHYVHYEERERLRTMLVEALNRWDLCARGLVDDADEHRIAELRKAI